ncbi:MAG: hypothetical protein QOD91_451, partial [Frankiales bacterium]|nr:hypothetical protein [Frankiales bacterium]
LHDVERVEDLNGVGQAVPQRVRVAVERIQRGVGEPGPEPGLAQTGVATLSRVS